MVYKRGLHDLKLRINKTITTASLEKLVSYSPIVVLRHKVDWLQMYVSIIYCMVRTQNTKSMYDFIKWVKQYFALSNLNRYGWSITISTSYVSRYNINEAFKTRHHSFVCFSRASNLIDNICDGINTMCLLTILI